MTLATLKTHFRNWREWELNPVVVKELRQSVRSWTVTGMLLLFLAVLFGASLIFLVNQSFQVSANQRLGADIFQVFTAILTSASLLFVPLYVGIRLAAERQESSLDLLYITTLSPGRIIRGKFFCGAYVTVLFFSACMPFMVFTNLLRGVDLPTVFFILLCLFLAVCAAIQAAIFLACLPISKLFKILVALSGTSFMFAIIGSLISMFFFMMRSGVGSLMISGGSFWPGFFTGAGVIFAAALLLYFLSVALISPPSANRALPLRIYITLIWLVGAGVSFAWMGKAGDVRVILPWSVVSYVLLVLALVVVVSSNDRLSLRVRRDIPVAPAKRALAFIFYNGAAGGLIWLALLLGATFAVASFVLHQVAPWLRSLRSFSPDDLWEFEVIAGAVLLYSFAYALTALWVHRRFLSRRSPKLAGIFAVLLPGTWALAPNILSFFLNRLSWTSLEKLQLGNIFNLFMLKDQSQKFTHLVFAAVWLALMLILNLRWFARQARQFQPLERNSPPAEPAAATAPPPVPGGAGALES